MIVIGLGHRAGVGKSTLADHLVSRHGFVQVAFADPLKAAAREIFSFSDAQVSTQEGKKTVDPFWGITPREALQKLGTEGVRDVFGQNTWVRAAQRRLQKEMDHVRDTVTIHERGYLSGEPRQARFVFTDVRFKSEAEWLKTVGKVWRVDRPGITDEVFRARDGTWYDKSTMTPLHSSETDLIEWKGWDAVLTGSREPDGGEALKLQADVLLKALNIEPRPRPTECVHGVERGVGCYQCSPIGGAK